MTPYEFGRRVKIAAETGGFGEYLGRGFDSGVRRIGSGLQSAGNAIGAMLPTPSPGYAAGGMGGVASTGAGAMQRMQMPQTSSNMPGVSDATPSPAGPGLSAEPPMAALPPPPAPRPAPRPTPPRPAPRPRRPAAPAAPVDEGPGLSAEVPAPAPPARSLPRPAAVRPAPRPATARPAPAAPKPTAPGVRRPGGRIA